MIAAPYGNKGGRECTGQGRGARPQEAARAAEPRWPDPAGWAPADNSTLRALRPLPSLLPPAPSEPCSHDALSRHPPRPLRAGTATPAYTTAACVPPVFDAVTPSPPLALAAAEPGRRPVTWFPTGPTPPPPPTASNRNCSGLQRRGCPGVGLRQLGMENQLPPCALPRLPPGAPHAPRHAAKGGSCPCVAPRGRLRVFPLATAQR